MTSNGGLAIQDSPTATGVAEAGFEPATQRL
jgi:hypothetical protein